MCYQVIELYSACRCLYYQHAVERCAAYGRTGHRITQRTILVGYSCSDHVGFRFEDGTQANRLIIPIIGSSPSHRSKQRSAAKQPTASAGLEDRELFAEAFRQKPTKRGPKPKKYDLITEHEQEFDRQALAGKPTRRTPLVPSESSGSEVTSLKVTSRQTSAHLESSPEAVNVKPEGTQTVTSHDCCGICGYPSNKNPLWRQSFMAKHMKLQHNIDNPLLPVNILSNEERQKDSPKYLDIDSSSDDSDLSESKSTISIASSTTTVDIDAVEAIFRELLQFQELRYLWPQVVRKSGLRKKSLRNIERFLRRYAEDLEELARNSEAQGLEKQAQVSAAQFLRKCRLNLAQRIFETHQSNCEIDSLEDSLGATIMHTIHDPEMEEKDSDDPVMLIYSVAEPFLFETDPILYLQKNVAAFVKLPSPKPATETIWLSFRTLFENTVAKLVRPPVPDGKKRIMWTCNCGMELFDDFEELRSGAVEELESQLNLSSQREDMYCEVLEEGESPQPPKHWKQAFVQPLQLLQNLFKGFARPGLPQYRPRRPVDMELGLCPTIPDSLRGLHNFVLLCIPFGRWATKLHQAEVCRINSDQDFFQVLRHYYSTQRGHSAWTRLRKVQSVEFVKFEMYRSQLVDVQIRPSIPPYDKCTDYAYEPMPTDVMPPIGRNHLMHLLEHPDHAEVTPVLYRKIPKKLRVKLEACVIQGSSIGWGLQFVEGMNWFVVFIYGCVGFSLALITALTWAMVKGDIQGAFAMAAFMITFLLFCGGIARSEIHV